ncbi:hypothetical protein HYPSUDRAFT_1074013, partial [Hypholoma sublateritium FD-334 SS-4]
NEIAFQKVVISGVDAAAPSSQLRAAAVRHKRAILLHTGLRVKSTSFDHFSETLASINEDTIRTVCDRVASGDAVHPNSADEAKILSLLNEVNAVAGKVPCSSASRVAMRNEIRGLIMEKGLPTFYLTINPADVYNPVLKLLAGNNIDVDKLL